MRMLVQGLALAAAMVAIAACTGDTEDSEVVRTGSIRAQSFELTDETGNVRALLAIRDGAPRLALIDDHGISRVEIKLDDAGSPALTLFDEDGTRRAGLEFAHGTNPALFLRDEEGRLKAGVQVQAGGAPVLFLRNSALEDGFAVTLIDNDLPVMALADPQGNNRAFLGLESERFSGSLVFVTADGTIEQTIP